MEEDTPADGDTPAVVLVEAAPAAASAQDEHTRVHELERAALHERIESRVQEAIRFGHEGLASRVDAVEARLDRLVAEVERLAREPEAAPEAVPDAAAEVIEAPADVIEPPSEEQERRAPAHRRRKKRRHAV